VRTVAIVVIVLVVLLVIVLAVLAGRRNKRRAALRERFGPEYDLAVKRGKDRRAVEQRLEALARQRDELDIRDVAPQEHLKFAREWDAAQARFVDDPGQAVADADGLVNSVLRSRGYPVESFDDRAALVATDHQDVVEGYRAAHDTFAGHLQSGAGDTEELRKAFLHYREVFGRLNVPAESSASGGPRAVEAPADRAALPASEPRPEPVQVSQVRTPEPARDSEVRTPEPVQVSEVRTPEPEPVRAEPAVTQVSPPPFTERRSAEADGGAPDGIEGEQRPERRAAAHRADPA
jgi:hypothetical protein